MFEELQSLIEGVSPGDLRLTVDSDPLDSDPRDPQQRSRWKLSSPPMESFPKGSSIIRKGSSTSGARLAQDLPADLNGATGVEIDDPTFARDLKSGERLEVIRDGKSRLSDFS